MSTTYIIPGLGISLKIGQTSDELDQIMNENKVKSWAFISAWNPLSEVLPDDENRKRDAALAIATQAYQTFRGFGKGDDPLWAPEESLLILGIERSQAIMLGRQFEQNAIVFGEIDREAELLLCISEV